MRVIKSIFVLDDRIFDSTFNLQTSSPPVNLAMGKHRTQVSLDYHHAQKFELRAFRTANALPLYAP